MSRQKDTSLGACKLTLVVAVEKRQTNPCPLLLVFKGTDMGRKVKNRNNRLVLKWGTLKSWDFSTDEDGKRLLQEYESIGSNASVMLQRDTERQKEIICELIDLVYGKIYLDWDGTWVSKKEAKKYVLEYDK